MFFFNPLSGLVAREKKYKQTRRQTNKRLKIVAYFLLSIYDLFHCMSLLGRTSKIPFLEDWLWKKYAQKMCEGYKTTKKKIRIIWAKMFTNSVWAKLGQLEPRNWIIDNLKSNIDEIGCRSKHNFNFKMIIRFQLKPDFDLMTFSIKFWLNWTIIDLK